jgi:hypothetical protein
VVRHIFQACPVWIYTQGNITSIIFILIHYTNTEKIMIVRLHWYFAFYNISQRNFGILLILWCSFKLRWNCCPGVSRSKFHS